MKILGRWELRRLPPPRPPRARPPVAVPGTPVTDLEQFIFAVMMGVHPGLRQWDAAWVMSPWWLQWCKQLAEPGGTPAVIDPIPHADGATMLHLLGIPVEVHGEGGWPHLEPISRARVKAQPGSSPRA